TPYFSNGVGFKIFPRPSYLPPVVSSAVKVLRVRRLPERMFPLSLCWKPLTCPCRIGLCIVPTDIYDRILVIVRWFSEFPFFIASPGDSFDALAAFYDTVAILVCLGAIGSGSHKVRELPYCHFITIYIIVIQHHYGIQLPIAPQFQVVF